MKSSTPRTRFSISNPIFSRSVGIGVLAASFLVLPSAMAADSKDTPKATAPTTKSPATPAKTGAGTAATKTPAATPAKSGSPAATKGATAAGPGLNGTGRPSIIDFSAVWCVPCKKFEPIYDKVANSYKGRVDFFHVDVDDVKQKAIVEKYKISIMPTVVFRDAKGVAKLLNEGVMDEKSLVQEVNNLLK